MFTQRHIENMSVTDLVSTIRKLSYSIENRIDNPYDTLDYCNALVLVSQHLQSVLESVTEE